MQLDTLHLPLDWQKIEIHREANRVGKRHIEEAKLPNIPNYGKTCDECKRIQTHCPNFLWCESQSAIQKRYSQYGPNCVLYLGFIRRAVIILFIGMLFFCVPMFVLNLQGDICQSSTVACNSQNIIYFWSTYNVLGSYPGSLPHHILWLIFSIGICTFTLYLRRYSIKMYRYINHRNTTDSQFCLLLRRLPSETTEKDIENLFEKQIFMEYNQLQPERKNNQTLEEMKNIRIRDIIFLFQYSKVIEVNDKNVEEFKKFTKKKENKQIDENAQFEPQPFPSSIKFINTAIVRFHNTRDKNIALQSVKTSLLSKIITVLFPFYNSQSQYKIKQKAISIQQAPHPTDLQWQNFGFPQASRITRKILSTVFCIVLLIMSSAITLFISVRIQALLEETHVEPTVLTIVLVLITVVINVIIQIIISWAIRQIKLDTITQENCSQLSVTIISESINLGFFSIFAPIIAKIPLFFPIKSSKSSSFPLVMFTTIIIQSFLGITIQFFLDYFQVIQHVLKILVQKQILVKTQTQAYNTFKGSDIPFVSCYAHLVKIIWFGFLYGVVSPICVAIAMLGLILFYYYQRSLFNSKYAIPIYGGLRLNSTMIDLLDYAALLIGLFNLFLYQTSQSDRSFPVDNSIIGISITNIVIGGIHAVLPWSTIFHRIYQKRSASETKVYKGLVLDTTYEQCYPAANPEIRKMIKGDNVHFTEKIIPSLKKITIEEFLEEEGRNVKQQNIQSGCCIFVGLQQVLDTGKQ